MQKYPVTILEAPSGFGKTTAIREYFKTAFQSTPIYWHTCLGESPQKTWHDICDIVGHVDSRVGVMLGNLELQNLDSLADFSAIIREMICEKTTFVIIDNFQLIDREMPDRLLQVFAHNTVTDLHVIILTHQLITQQIQYLRNESILVIDVGDFLFSKDSIVRYFRLSGIRINNEDLERIHKHTGGWVAAIQLQLLNYQEKGVFEQTSGDWELIEYAIWHKLKREEQQFLISVSVLEGFNLQQAAVLMDKKSLPEGIARLLRNNTLIQYAIEEQVYSIHSILRDFLRNRFYSEFDIDMQKRMMKRAGESYLFISDYYHAIQIFYQNENYESILEMPLRNDYFNYDDERYLLEWILLFLKRCPVDTLVRYPMSLITFAFQFILFGHFEEYGYLCGIIGSVLDNPYGLSQSELQQLQGEMAFVQSFTKFNDVEKMVEHYIAAFNLLGRPSRFNVTEGAWTFGGVSVLYMFWNKQGTLMSTIDCLENNFHYYTQLTRGHGTGGDSVMKAEALLMQGNDQDAEALCHKALYLAHSNKQTSVCLCAELVLGRIALLRGDSEGFELTLKSIRKYLSSPSSDWQIKRMVELCIATLRGIMGEKMDLPEWILKLDGSNQEMYEVIKPYCHILYGKYLLLSKRYNEIFGLTSPYLEMAQSMNYLLPQVYQFIYLAIAKRAQGKNTEAQEYLRKGMDIALSDEIYLPFAENAQKLLPILRESGTLLADRIQLGMMIDLCNRQLEGVEAVIKVHSNTRRILTPRETEIAILAKKGHTVKVIAELLFISDETVKTILKSVYRKLEIHSKVELGSIDF